MAQSSVELFGEKVAELKRQGLKDIKFYPGMISETLPEQFCVEANRLIDAMLSGEGKKLSFNDSRRK